MATKLHQRSFALIMAVLFLATSVAFSAVVVYELTQDDEPTVSEQSIEELIQEQSEASNQANNNQEQQEANVLQGTQLASFDPTGQVDEIQVIDLQEGDGEVVSESATVTAHYTGAYAVNGEIFESSKDSGSPFSSPLSGLIQGWQQGIPGMKVGGTRRLIIPGNLAYGEAPEGYEPGAGGRPLGTLVFDIEMISVEQ